MEIRIDLITVVEFSVWVEIISFVFGLGIKNYIILQWASNWLESSGDVDINLIFVWRIEFVFVLVLGSKWAWFWCGGSKLTVSGPELT